MRPEPAQSEAAGTLGAQGSTCFIVRGSSVQQGLSMGPQEPRIRRRSAIIPSMSQRPMLSDVEIGSLLGRGAYGYVYRARWLSTDVAIKVVESVQIDGQDPKTDDLEAILSLDIAHPNIVQSYHYSARPPTQRAACLSQPEASQASRLLGYQEGCKSVEHSSQSVSQGPPADAGKAKVPRETWMVLEYCDKGSLQGALDRGWLHQQGGRPNMQDILQCAIEIGGALRYLHSRCIIHGDLTASNVLLSSCSRDARGWMCKVSDFGLSRVLDEDTYYTKTYGTVTHMPPELMLHGSLSRATDVYSFGVLLWELYTGQRPWAGLRQPKIVVTVTLEGKQLEFPFGTPNNFKVLAESCMSRNPRRRPTFDQVLKDLERLEASPTSKLQTAAFPLHVL
ncbi:hypothetical protein WJX84_008297 [Apatococcus fuscideae]|uniref:Protein kinase domain-containing protein n=1 Tax=Apatococcus fuscideae TaxID=2026836 RepID=A0AAW1T6A0_9CHLO